MSWVRYWPLLEMAVILSVFSIVIVRLWRSAKERAGRGRQELPKSRGGKIRFTILYVLRLAGVGLGTLLAVTLAVMIERSLFTVITDSTSAPSHVKIPADLPFKVEETAFTSEDGLTLAGWYVPPQNGVMVILLHGYGGNRTAMIWHAQQLTAAGYGVLMYDERASGESEGTYRSYGWEDLRDVGGAIRFLSAHKDTGDGRIGIAGCSIGGQIALQSAAQYPQIEAVWADGPGSVRAQDIPPSHNILMEVVIAANYMVDWLSEAKLGIEAPPPMIEVIDEIAPRPIMLVGGGQPKSFFGSEGDFFLPRYAKYAGSNAQTWVIPEATHCDGPARRPGEYATRMIGFFDTAFGIERR
jgi:pimeloyl-ACP methyl ester carboxylesterase